MSVNQRLMELIILTKDPGNREILVSSFRGVLILAEIDRVNFLRISLYDAVLWIWAENSVDNTRML